MLIRFLFTDGSNPYLAKTNEKIFRMFCKYYTQQVSRVVFEVIAEREWFVEKDYKHKKDILREVAIEWQSGDFNYAWDDLINWGNFFEEMGRKYGLLTEFRENGIC